MFKSFTNLFIPNTKESAQRYRSKIGIFQGWISVGVNGVLFLIKITLGLMTGAVSLIADAVHTFSDLITSYIVIWGFKQAEKPADVEHPYGHGRAEYIATLIIAILLCVAGIEIIEYSVDRIQNPESVEVKIWMIILLTGTVIIKEITARYGTYLSSLIASGTLHADAWHHRTDALSSLMVVGAMIAGLYGYPSVDGWAGLGVALFLLYTGFDIAKGSVDDLIGRPPTPEEVENIRNIVMGVPGVLGAHDITVHSYGHDKFISIHVEVDARETTAAAHDISEEVESKLEEILGVEPTVHIDPVHPGNPLVKKIQDFLQQYKVEDEYITDVHDIRVVETENHHVILFGVNVKTGMSQSQIISCTTRAQEKMKQNFPEYEINIKVSPLHRF